jgi:Sulfotransferase family
MGAKMDQSGMLGTLLENLPKAWQVRYPTAILCHRFKCMYYPVPKAATSTIKLLMAEMNHQAAEGDPHHDIIFESVWGKEASQYDDYLSFTVVRNPWDRLLSCYTAKIVGRLRDPSSVPRTRIHEGFERYNRIFRRELFRPDMSFSEFLRVIAWIPDRLADEHFRSQYRLVSTPGGSLLPKRILKLENLQVELKQLLSDLGATGFSVGHLAASRRPNYRSVYTDDTRHQVARLYRRDVELFGYSF